MSTVLGEFGLRKPLPAPWWVRLVLRFVRREVANGHLRLERALTYHECLQFGCTEREALDYVRRSHLHPFVTVWRGQPFMTTAGIVLLPDGLKPKEGPTQ